MKLYKKEVIIGFSVVVAILVLIFGIDFLKGANVFKASNYYYASYTNAAGLQKSAAVTVNGFKVGLVREISYQYNNPGHILVEMSLDKNLRLPQGTRAVIEQDLLGTPSVVLQLAPAAAGYYAVGDTLTGDTNGGMMETLTKSIVPATTEIFPKIDTLITNLNTLTGNPALTASITRLDAITRELELTLRQLRATTGALPPVMANVKGITTNLNTASADLAIASAKVRQAPIDTVMTNLAALSTNLRALSLQLNDPNTSLGLLTRDPSLYRNLNSAATSLDSLLIDVKRNPKRYISIKLL